jgi:O-antigen ligase
VVWKRKPDRAEAAVDAHSLYIETLAELGLVGGVFLLAWLTGIALSAGRLYGADPATATGLVAVLLVWVVHTGLDWDWEMPALTGMALVAAAALVAWGDEAAA